MFTARSPVASLSSALLRGASLRGISSRCYVLSALLLGICAACSPSEKAIGSDDTNEPAPTKPRSGKPTRPEGDSGSDPSGPKVTGPQPTTPAPTCPVPDYPQDDEATAFERLDTRVLDQTGNGVPNTTAQVCGLNICLYGSTDDLGVVHHVEHADLARAAFKYGDGLHYAQFARLLTGSSEYDLKDQVTVAFPDLAKAPKLVGGGSLSSGQATLDVTDSDVKIDLLSFPDEADHGFVAAELDKAKWPEAVPADQGLEMLYALGPLKTKFCPPAGLTLPNTPGWKKGVALDLLLHIVDTSNHWGAYGTFAVVGHAHVSDDGKTIATDADAGIPELGVIGLRLSE
jgi:hypothetical protein